MKLIEDNEVILGSAGATSKFKIAASAKAFKILSSGLYKNKIRAVVRELTCNVVDAHKLNGTKDAFEIKAPTQLDPRFIIRDFGPGLNEDDITNLYSTYFASTKSNSNDFIGALGLGSKSPFSYTDTFTVVSYHGGKVRGFTAMLDGGEPTLRKVFEEDMKDEEKTGIEITVPVKLTDINRWHEEIKYVLRPFADWPHVLKGCSAPQYFPTRAGKTRDWFALNLGYEEHGLFAVYGNIVYPLNDVPGLNRPWMSVNNSSVFIHFDLGELDIAASREELSLDEMTIANIISRVNNLSNVEMKETIDNLNKITNERELLRTLNKMNNEATNIIEKSGIKVGELPISQLRAKYDVPNDLAEYGCAYEICANTKMKKIVYNSSYSSVKVSISRLFNYQKTEINILLDDKSSKRVKVVRGLAYKYPNKIGKDLVVYNTDSPEEMKAFETVKKLFGDDEINVWRVSECNDIIACIPVDENDAKEKRPASNNVSTYTWNTQKHQYDVESFRMTSVELKDLEGPVILKKRDDFHDFITGKEIVNFHEHTMNHVMGVLKFKEFHVVRSSVVDRLVKYGQCTSLIEEITEQLIDLVDAVNYDQYIGSPSYGYRIKSVINNSNGKLDFLMNYLSLAGTSTKESDKLNLLIDYICFYPADGADHDLYKVKNIVQDLKKCADSTASSIMKEFEKNNYLIYYVLNNCYNINDDIINDIKLLIETKSAVTAP